MHWIALLIKCIKFIFQINTIPLNLQILRSPAVWISNGSSDSDDFAITGINYILKYIKIEMSFKFLILFHNMTFIDHILSIFYLRVSPQNIISQLLLFSSPKAGMTSAELCFPRWLPWEAGLMCAYGILMTRFSLGLHLLCDIQMETCFVWFDKAFPVGNSQKAF